MTHDLTHPAPIERICCELADRFEAMENASGNKLLHTLRFGPPVANASEAEWPAIFLEVKEVEYSSLNDDEELCGLSLVVHACCETTGNSDFASWRLLHAVRKEISLPSVLWTGCPERIGTSPATDQIPTGTVSDLYRIDRLVCLSE